MLASVPEGSVHKEPRRLTLAWFLAFARQLFINPLDDIAADRPSRLFMETSVEALCNTLARLKLLDAGAVRALRQRWLQEGRGDVADVGKFGKWLVAHGYATDFQLTMLNKGVGEQLLFNDYTLLDRIGQGRMAGVYRAAHPTGQQVAIKVLPPSKANNPQLLARFQREARLAVRLDHPNVVRTFQQGVTRAGLNYIVMEYLDGESLEEALRRRRALSPVEAVHVGFQVLVGLQHLFEEGMVHRDLKPANLMLVPGRKPGQPDTTLHSVVKVLDIGLGRALFDEGAAVLPENVDLTAEGSILGTMNYMAPEQARSAHTADIRADIYSLGCVLYEVLAGRPPFEDPNFMNQILRHATEPPRPLREVNPVVPEALWGVIEVMLAKDPARRYSTPQQAAWALRASIPAPAEVPRPTEPTPKMRSFLTWLALNGTTAAIKPADAPPVPASAAAPTQLSASEQAPAVEPAKPVAAPAAAPTTTAPARSETPATQENVNTPPDPEKWVFPPTPPPPTSPVYAVPVSPGLIPLPPKPLSSEKNPAVRPATEKEPPAQRNGLAVIINRVKALGITRRDLIVAGISAGVVLALQGIVWLLLRLLRVV
jgi:serine/threonine protein kinase